MEIWLISTGRGAVVRVPVPVLVSVTTCGELVVPTSCGGKVTVLGVRLSWEVNPFPESWIA